MGTPPNTSQHCQPLPGLQGWEPGVSLHRLAFQGAKHPVMQNKQAKSPKLTPGLFFYQRGADIPPLQITQAPRPAPPRNLYILHFIVGF